jgi:hypothetical protein
LSQLLSHPAIFPCVLAVVSRVFPVLLPMTKAGFGCVFECLRGSVLTSRGFVHAVGCTSLCCPRMSQRLLGSLTGAECLLCGPLVPVRFGLVDGFCLGH